MRKPYDMSTFKRADSVVVTLDNHLLALLDLLVVMGLADSWEVKINGPIDHDYTATKLMQKVAKKALKNHESIEG
jgi:hypothetical protein